MACCGATYIHFHRNYGHSIVFQIYLKTIFFLAINNIIQSYLFKINLLLRTSWLWVWMKYSLLTLECKHLNLTEIPAKQSNLEPTHKHLLSWQIVWLLKYDPMPLIIQFLTKNQIIHIGRLKYFYSHLKLVPSYIIGYFRISHWLKEKKILPQRTLHRQAWKDWFAGDKELTFAYHKWYHKM